MGSVWKAVKPYTIFGGFKGYFGGDKKEDSSPAQKPVEPDMTADQQISDADTAATEAARLRQKKRTKTILTSLQDEEEGKSAKPTLLGGQ